MAEFLRTAGVSAQLEHIIASAKEQLVLISPYLKVNDLIKESLEKKSREFLDDREGYFDRVKRSLFDKRENDLERGIYVIYGKKIDQPEANNWLASSSSIRIRFRENLHAKCYLNEDRALLTSMNLHEFSQQNNDEMGILVSRKEDRQLYERIYEDALRIVRVSREISVADVGDKDAENGGEHSRAKPRRTPDTPKDGFCIRCKAGLAVSPARPYCKRCYTSWKQSENPDYEESHCHTCGNESKATLRKPLCYACYSKYKNVFEFSVD